MKCQQDELYQAQRSVTLGRSLTVDEAQAMVDRLRDESWWPEQVLRVEVYGRPSGRSVGSFRPLDNAGLIELSRDDLNERTLCHELAHVLAMAIYGSQAHDPWYARCFLEVVYYVMGSDAYTALKTGFVEVGVDHDAEGLSA